LIELKITGNSLTLNDFIDVARYKRKIILDEDAIQKVKQTHSRIKTIVEGNTSAYGINTGFGKLSDVSISKENLSELQLNLLKSHACGVGEPFSSEIVRGIMLLRINALCKGFSGIRLHVIEQIVTYLNNDIIPVIPSQGSLGASGDLAPLSHMGLTLLGYGEVFYKNEKQNTKVALKQAGIEPVEHLVAKEGLSLINGTQAMCAVGAITLYDAINLAKLADIAGALSLEALYGIRDAFDERVHLARNQQGQIKVALNIRNLTNGSTYLSNQGELRVQDAYSLRCLAQVHGASRDAFKYIQEKLEIEMNAATDNPLIFDEDVISGGNFHGQPLAIAFDFMKVAIAELANISERRIERLVNPQLSCGLPAFLVANPGINSGFMIVQYSAASLVSENKVFAHPASVDSIPSSANQEDHVSMGTIAARGAHSILQNSQKVIAMELLSSCQAIDLRESKTLGRGSKTAYKIVRDIVSFIANDEIMYEYINKMIDLVEDGGMIKQVELSLDKDL
jgi:histidine ammonia-lyase